MEIKFLTYIFLFSSLLVQAQTRDLSNFIEIIPEQHTRIVTGRPAQVFVKNSQDYVIDIAGATGYWKNMAEPHISPASALVHIKNGRVQSPQLKVNISPREYYTCVTNVYQVESFKEESFIQVRSACSEAFIDRFFLKHASSSFIPTPQQKIHLIGTNILHQKILKYGEEAYALIVETPEVKANGAVNRGGLGSDSVVLAHLDFENETYDTVAFFRLPAQPYQNINSFFGKAKINADFSKIYLNAYDTLFTLSFDTQSTEVKLLSNDQYFNLEDRQYFINHEYSADSAFYKNILKVDYRFNEGNPTFDTSVVDLPQGKFSTDNYLSIFRLNSTKILISETRYLEDRELHLGITLADELGNILWEKQFVPDYTGLILYYAQNVNDTIILSGAYKPGRFGINRQTNVQDYFATGFRRTVSFRVLADGTNLDAEKLSIEPELEVFPNPFYVDFKIVEEGATKYELINTKGIIVNEGQLNPDIGIYRIYEPQLEFGMYILRVFKLNGEMVQKKLFKLN